MKYLKSSLVVSGMAIIIMATPLATFAKDNGKGNSKGNSIVNRVENSIGNAGRGIGNAFGHLIAPGWLKKNGTTTTNVDVGNLPPGIANKLNGEQNDNENENDNENKGSNHHNNGDGNGTSTPVSAPVISNLTTDSITSSGARITWATDEYANSAVWFGTTNPVDTSATPNIISNSLVKNHSFTLNNLTANTTYYVAVRSTNVNGTVNSNQISFLTSTTTVNQTPLVLSGVDSSALGQTQAQISWNTNNPATGTIWYSTTTPVNTATAQTVSSNSNAYNHYFLLNNLTASTTYYFLVGSTDTYGNTATSSGSSFTTPVAPVVNPTLAITNAVAIIGSTSATLTWNTNIAADSEAFYSTSSPVVIGATSTTAVTSGTLVTSHSLSVPNLATSTLYYMIIQSKDASNNTQSTGQFSFTTGL